MVDVEMGLNTTGQINGTKSVMGHKYEVAVLGSERPLEDAGGWEPSASAPGPCEMWACWVPFGVTSCGLPVLYVMFFPAGSVIHGDKSAEPTPDQAWSSVTLHLLLQAFNYFWLHARLM